MKPMFWIWDAILFILPAYIANSIPVLLGGGPPVDGGKTWTDGRPILGKGKTIRGTLVAIAAATIIGALYQFFPPAGTLSGQITILLGFIMGIGTVLGDIIGSFLKRRINLKRGATLPIVDQDGFVLVTLILVNFITRIPLEYWIFLLVLTPFVHLAFNVIAYFAKWKDVPY